jgi:PAS domain-containing protein
MDNKTNNPGTTMSLIDMQDYTPSARIYWWTVTVLGVWALVFSIAVVGELHGTALLQVLAGAAVAAVVGLLPVRIPGAKTSIAGGEIFIFLVMLVYGAPAAVLAAAVEGGVGALRTTKRWTSRIGTPAMASVAMLVCASVFEAARSFILAHGFNGGAIIAAVMVFAVLYWVASTLLTSTLIALKRGLPFTPKKWLKEMSWIGLAYAAGASISGVLFIGFEQFGLPALMISVPLIAMFLSTLHYYFERKVDDQRHMEQLKESESRFHSALSHAAIGMALVTIEVKFIQANKAFSDMLGRSPAEVLAAVGRSRALRRHRGVAAVDKP